MFVMFLFGSNSPSTKLRSFVYATSLHIRRSQQDQVPKRLIVFEQGSLKSDLKHLISLEMGAAPWEWLDYRLHYQRSCSLPFWEYVVFDRTPISSIDRILRGFLNDLVAAHSDVEAEEILYCYQIGSVLLFVEGVVPGAGIVEGREFSLE
jgi:hypothetical protein